LRLLEDLPDWEVYREVAAVLEGAELVAWRRLYESRPERDILLEHALRVWGARGAIDAVERRLARRARPARDAGVVRVVTKTHASDVMAPGLDDSHDP
jgi:hypothetical protein